MATSSGDSEYIQNLGDSAPELFSFHYPDSELHWSLPEGNGTRSEGTVWIDDLDQQLCPYTRPELPPLYNGIEHISAEGFMPWNPPSSISYLTGPSGFAARGDYDVSSFGLQEGGISNSRQPWGGDQAFDATGEAFDVTAEAFDVTGETFDITGDLHLLRTPHDGNHDKVSAASTRYFDYPEGQASHSQHQKEKSDDVGGLVCSWQGCTYSGKFARETALWRHIKSKHVQPNHFKCANCGKEFERKDKMRAHYRMMHEDLTK